MLFPKEKQEEVGYEMLCLAAAGRAMPMSWLANPDAQSGDTVVPSPAGRADEVWRG